MEKKPTPMEYQLHYSNCLFLCDANSCNYRSGVMYAYVQEETDYAKKK